MLMLVYTFLKARKKKICKRKFYIKLSEEGELRGWNFLYIPKVCLLYIFTMFRYMLPLLAFYINITIKILMYVEQQEERKIFKRRKL